MLLNSLQTVQYLKNSQCVHTIIYSVIDVFKINLEITEVFELHHGNVCISINNFEFQSIDV